MLRNARSTTNSVRPTNRWVAVADKDSGALISPVLNNKEVPDTISAILVIFLVMLSVLVAVVVLVGRVDADVISKWTEKGRKITGLESVGCDRASDDKPRS